MAWFKTKRDVIDLTEMQKQGIVKQARKTSDEVSGYRDFSETRLRGSEENVDLFGAIASNASTPSSNTATNNKLEDIEFKLDSLRKKVDDMLNRLEVVERKSGVYGR